MHNIIVVVLLCCRLEKQRASIQDKITQQQAKENAVQIKAQMEETLKQQRLALQLKRQLDSHKATTSVVLGSTPMKTIISSSPSGILKTVTAVQPISSSLIKKINVQPKTIITAGCEYEWVNCIANKV